MATKSDSHIEQGVFSRRSSPKEPNPGPVPVNRLRKLGVEKGNPSDNPFGVGPVSKDNYFGSNQRKTY